MKFFKVKFYYFYEYLEALVITQTHLHATNDETNDNSQFWMSYLVVAPDAVLETGTAVISVVSRFISTCHGKIFLVSRNSVASR
jgi:hypothetical protein